MDSAGIMSAMTSAAERTGIFDAVLAHEPKSAPNLGTAPTLALFSGPLTTITSSGLASASVRWQINGRVYRNGFAEPADQVDPELVSATSAYIRSLADGFTLGGLIRCVDFFGMDGEPLKAESGYLEMDKKIYRCMELEIPLLINDEWDLVP